MRQTPDTVTITAQASDPYSTIPGPFNSSLTMKIWAEERPIDLVPDNVTTRIPIDFPGTTSNTVTVASGYQTFYGPLTITEVGTTGISGRTTSISDVAKLGIQADGSQLAFWADASRSIVVPSVTVSEGTWVFRKVIKKYWIDRVLASYGTGGYIGDFSDTIVNSQQIEVWTDLVHPGGG
jgi:hypothetical protein